MAAGGSRDDEFDRRLTLLENCFNAVVDVFLEHRRSQLRETPNEKVRAALCNKIENCKIIKSEEYNLIAKMTDQNIYDRHEVTQTLFKVAFRKLVKKKAGPSAATKVDKMTWLEILPHIQHISTLETDDQIKIYLVNTFLADASPAARGAIAQ